jgi:hypothetical protein
MMRGLEGVGRERESVRCVWGGQHIAMRVCGASVVCVQCGLSLGSGLGLRRVARATGACMIELRLTSRCGIFPTAAMVAGRLLSWSSLSLSLSPAPRSPFSQEQNFIFNESPDHRQENSGSVAMSVLTSSGQQTGHKANTNDALCAHVRGSVQQPWVFDTTSAWHNV